MLSNDLTLKYPNTFKAIQPCHTEKQALADSLLSALKHKATRYWPAPGVNSDIFTTRFPDQTQLIRMAERATQGYIMYWHPWHMEVTHKSYRLSKDIDWFTTPTGDHEWVDSLVRFTHMIDLAAAYELTHEEKYLRSFENYLNSFSTARNTPGRHWKFLINVAVRLINLIRAYDLISQLDSLPLSTHLQALENITLDVDFLLNALPKVRANGAFFATTALLIASEYLAEIFAVDQWRAVSEKKLYEIFDTEIQPDLIEVEQVPMYHGQVILALLDYCIILKANGRSINNTLAKTIKGMLEALLKLCDPEGKIPPIGDSDRFSVSYITDCYNAVFETTPIQNSDNFIPLDAAQHCNLSILETSGWVVARWNYDSQKQGYLLFDCSGKPKEQKSGHSHADDLQFLLHTSHGPVFTDPGRFTYCTDFKAYYPFTKKRIYPIDKFGRLYTLIFPEFMALYGRNWKEYFKRTLSHNTISLNGTNQPGYIKRTDPRSKTELLQHKNIGPLVLLQGLLNTSTQQKSEATLPYQHQRTILGVLPHLWIIVDQMKAEQHGNWISSYHLDAEGKASMQAQNIHIESKGDSHSMTFLSSTDTLPKLSIDDDWFSHIYNKKQPSQTIRATMHDTSEVTLVTLIQALDDNAMHIDTASTIKMPANDDGSNDIFRITLSRDDSVTTLIINPGCQSLKQGELEFNAMLSIESRHGVHLTEAGFLGGTFLRSHDFSLSCTAQEHGAYQTFMPPEQQKI